MYVESHGVSPIVIRLSRRLTARQFDWLAFAATLGMALPAVGYAAGRGQLAVCLAVLPFATLPLLWRRTRPGLALILLLAALGASIAIGRSAPSNVGVLFGLYAAARYGGERVRAFSAAIAGGATLSSFALLFATGRARPVHHVTAAIALGAAAAWLLGEVTRTRRAHLLRLEQRAVDLEHERDQQARVAADAERVRIARELHDVVTHNVSAIAVQAAAANSTSGTRPERAGEALAVIETAARSTLSELRALLGVLRAQEGAAPRSSRHPPPTLAQMDDLFRRARDAGIGVTSHVLGRPVKLDAAVELAAYRVLQEAFTNVLKHAPGAEVDVVVDYRGDALRIAVSDDGRGGEQRASTGYGLIGMRERVHLAGGELHAGPHGRAGFSVEALLPIGATREDRGDAGSGELPAAAHEAVGA